MRSEVLTQCLQSENAEKVKYLKKKKGKPTMSDDVNVGQEN